MIIKKNSNSNVFISSTYIDLKKHREKIWEKLKQFKVNVLGMEEFGARSSNSLITCLDEVKKSQIFICIIGVRYGSIDKKTGKSYTQLEYETAIENKSEILIYLIDDNKSFVRPLDFDVENYSKLNKFKDVLQQNHTVDFFANEFDLSKKVTKRLLELVPIKIEKNYRPEILDCKITRIKIKNTYWMFFVGFFNERPIELFIYKDQYISFSYKIKTGEITRRKVLENNVKEYHYDLTWYDEEGYMITLRQISKDTFENGNKINKLISTLLINDISIDVILSLLPNINISEIEDLELFKKGLKKALKN